MDGAANERRGEMEEWRLIGEHARTFSPLLTHHGEDREKGSEETNWTSFAGAFHANLQLQP